MKILKIILSLLLIPIFLFFVLFFEYLGFFNLVLVFSVFFFRDLKKFELLWFLILIAIILDVSMHFWFGTYFLSISIVILLLIFFERLIGNFFLEIFVVFITFVVFFAFFQAFIFFQETSFLPSMELEFFYDAILLAAKSFFVYLLLKTGEYFFKSYFRSNIV